MTNQANLNLDALVASIRDIHEQMAAQAGKAVNISLTLRNWLIGCHIADYELCGADRAKYGDKLLSELALKLANVSNCNRRQLYRYLRLYRFYPRIVGTLPPQFQKLSITASAAKKVATASPQCRIPAEILISCLSYSHFDLLVDIDDETKRAFYEQECIRGIWSVRELKRQIASLYFERSGLSRNKEKLAALARAGAEQAESKLDVRDPYVFEFLGIKPAEVMHESDLERALIDKLQDFLLELGHGFCFEARQRRILIGGEHFFVDLVFYHRVLKCHVLVELKIAAFNQENIGQLNTYVTWFRKNMMTEGDNPPVGLLLCTDKNHALVEYALAGMDNNLFVSRYQFELPSPETIERFLQDTLADEVLP